MDDLQELKYSFMKQDEQKRINNMDALDRFDECYKTIISNAINDANVGDEYYIEKYGKEMYETALEEAKQYLLEYFKTIE